MLSLRDWLKEEVRIQNEANELAHGIEAQIVGATKDCSKHSDKGGRSRNLFSKGSNFGRVIAVPTSKPPYTVEETMVCGGVKISRIRE